MSLHLPWSQEPVSPSKRTGAVPWELVLLWCVGRKRTEAALWRRRTLCKGSLEVAFAKPKKKKKSSFWLYFFFFLLQSLVQTEMLGAAALLWVPGLEEQGCRRRC